MTLKQNEDVISSARRLAVALWTSELRSYHVDMRVAGKKYCIRIEEIE